MTRHERVGREIQVAFDLLRHLIAHPEDLEDIPSGSYVDVVAPDHVPQPVPEGKPLVLFESTRVFRRVRSAV